MKRILLELQFYGKRYCGFQVQKNSSTPTIQGEVQAALKKLFEREIEITGCSRTDSGVSAESYFCHFDVESKLPSERICFKLNRFLPKDIQAVSSVEVAPTFDARACVTKKTYLYTLYQSEHILPLYAREGVQIGLQVDLQKMKQAAKLLLGKHDFSAFRTLGYEDGAEKKNTVRTLYNIQIVQEGKWVKVFVTGDGFLYNMVRIVVGTLVEVGEGKRSQESVQDLLDGGKREQAGKTMPPKGLHLYKVYYE